MVISTMQQAVEVISPEHPRLTPPPQQNQFQPPPLQQQSMFSHPLCILVISHREGKVKSFISIPLHHKLDRANASGDDVDPTNIVPVKLHLLQLSSTYCHRTDICQQRSLPPLCWTTTLCFCPHGIRGILVAMFPRKQQVVSLAASRPGRKARTSSGDS